MLIKTIFIFLLICSNISLTAQSFSIPLWNDTPPNFIACGEKEIQEFKDGINIISYVQNPEIAVFLPTPRLANGKAVIICPGGGYWVLAYDLEGTDIAKYFNSKGIAAIVLKYRLPVSKSNIEPYKTPLLDAQRAMRIVRHNAEKWNINANQIGIMGFSAGGHLASTLSTHFDLGDSTNKDSIERHSCRPDFSLLIYPVITFNNTDAHHGSCEALLGDKISSDSLKQNYSSELMVNENTPPAILILASNDKTVDPLNSILYFQALQKYNIKAELHIYPYGGHGFGLATNIKYLSEWPDKCVNFIHYLFDE